MDNTGAADLAAALTRELAVYGFRVRVSVVADEGDEEAYGVVVVPPHGERVVLHDEAEARAFYERVKPAEPPAEPRSRRARHG